MPNYHPEKAFCNLDSKLEVSNQISMMLNTIFRGPQIDIFSLSFYYAHFLKEDLYDLYRKALTGCTLEDTAGIMFFPYDMNEMMLNLMDKLGNQLRKENFWIVSAEWIEELKELRNMTAGHLYAVAFNRGYLKAEKEVREKTIDDFVRFASDMPTVETEDGEIRPMWLEEMAEQLKAGGENE